MYRHLHLILHELISLPPSQPLPSLLIIAHKADLLKGSASADAGAVAISRVKTVLERELERRRQNQTGGVTVEGLGEEDAERSDWGGLECGAANSTFHFDDWEGGPVTFLATSVRVGQQAIVDEKAAVGLSPLWEWLEDNI